MRIPVKFQCGHKEERNLARAPVSVSDYQGRISKRFCPVCENRRVRRAARQTDREEANGERLVLLGIVAAVVQYLRETPLSPVEERYIRLYTRRYLGRSSPGSGVWSRSKALLGK